MDSFKLSEVLQLDKEKFEVVIVKNQSIWRDAAMWIENEKTELPIDNLPNGSIDWDEISRFIEDMLNPDYRSEKGWKIIKDESMMRKLNENSVLLLNMLYDDLYSFFYKLHAERYEVWNRMEHHIRAKYGQLSENAISRIITTYHIDDR